MCACKNRCFFDNSWTLIPWNGAGPRARTGHSLVAFEQHIWLFGGDGGPLAGRLNDLWRWSFESKEWAFVESGAYLKFLQKVSLFFVEKFSSEGDIPPPSVKHTAAIVDGSMVVYGGWDWERAFKDLHLFDFGDSKIYLDFAFDVTL